MKGRFAPSPTGRMHLGNVYSALLSWLSARSQGGQWLLRIEDIDRQRSRQEYAEQIMDDLRWLGLTWDEGPYYQSQRGDIYQQHLEILNARGLLYPCRCTRADIMATQAPHESDGRVVYKGTCRPKTKSQFGNLGNFDNLGNVEIVDNIDDTDDIDDIDNVDNIEKNQPLQTLDGEKLRIIVPDRDIAFTDLHYGPQTVNLATHCGDFILRRADGAWAYQLAVVVDDALMGVTEVVRGRDLLLSAAQQIYLFEQLGYTAPRFCHLPLLCNEAGQRLSKRDKSLDMGELRNNKTAAGIVGELACYAGVIDRPEPVMPHDIVGEFAWANVPTADIVVSGQ